ncbi:MAG: TM2 domain-containing protein [Clostridia bacterium]|nr:TM2 domain-containing protein [Clostridia bacterium]
MAKILTISADIIEIGMDDWSIKEVPADSLNFLPHVGDKVEIFQNSNKIIVSKVEEKEKITNPTQGQQQNIAINNINTNVNHNGRRGIARNKWVALALCVFLGFAGAHKFYEQKVVMGVLYILTMGVFGFGLIIDFITILFKPTIYYV